MESTVSLSVVYILLCDKNNPKSVIILICSQLDIELRQTGSSTRHRLLNIYTDCLCMTENKHNCLQGVHTAKITTQADMTNKVMYELTQQKVYSVRLGICNHVCGKERSSAFCKF